MTLLKDNGQAIWNFTQYLRWGNAFEEDNSIEIESKNQIISSTHIWIYALWPNVTVVIQIWRLIATELL